MKKKAVLIMMGIALLCAGCGKGQAEVEAPIGSGDAAIIEENETTEAEETDTREASDEGGQIANEEIITDTESPREDGGDVAVETEEISEDAGAGDEQSPGSERDLFADFIMGKGAAKVAATYEGRFNSMDSIFKSGEELTVNDIKQKLAEQDEILKEVDPKISYAPLTANGRYLYAFQLYYEGPWEAYTELFVLSQKGEDLEILFGIDGWSRRGISINEFGIVSDSGSNGAGSHGDDIYAPDGDFVYHTVSSTEENYIGWDFYDESAQPIDALNNTMHQVEETYPELVEKVCFYREIIDGKTYFYYLGTDKITQDTVDKIDRIAKENGFTFDGKAAADEARVAYAAKLGVDEAIKSLAEPAWKSLN